MTEGNLSNPQAVIDLLNDALATEIVCVLRYKRHQFMATGIHARDVAAQFAENAAEEQGHADRIAARIQQLDGEPNFDPQGLATRSHTEYVAGKNLGDMIREDLVAERVAIQTYSEIIRYLGNDDPTTRRLMEEINAEEEEHAEEMKTLLDNIDKDDRLGSGVADPSAYPGEPGTTAGREPPSPGPSLASGSEDREVGRAPTRRAGQGGVRAPANPRCGGEARRRSRGALRRGGRRYRSTRASRCRRSTRAPNGQVGRSRTLRPRGGARPVPGPTRATTPLDVAGGAVHIARGLPERAHGLRGSLTRPSKNRRVRIGGREPGLAPPARSPAALPTDRGTRVRHERGSPRRSSGPGTASAPHQLGPIGRAPWPGPAASSRPRGPPPWPAGPVRSGVPRRDRCRPRPPPRREPRIGPRRPGAPTTPRGRAARASHRRPGRSGRTRPSVRWTRFAALGERGERSHRRGTAGAPPDRRTPRSGRVGTAALATIRGRSGGPGDPPGAAPTPGSSADGPPTVALIRPG